MWQDDDGRWRLAITTSDDELIERLRMYRDGRSGDGELSDSKAVLQLVELGLETDAAKRRLPEWLNDGDEVLEAER